MNLSRGQNYLQLNFSGQTENTGMHAYTYIQHAHAFIPTRQFIHNANVNEWKPQYKNITIEQAMKLRLRSGETDQLPENKSCCHEHVLSLQDDHAKKDRHTQSVATHSTSPLQCPGTARKPILYPTTERRTTFC